MTKYIVIVGSLLILLTQAVFQTIAAKTDSQTTDEAVHVVAGYTYIKNKDFRLNPEHPPLVKTLSAVPLLFINPNLPTDFDEKWNDSESFFYDSWRENRYLGEQFFWNSGNDADQMVFWSRIPIVLLTLLLGLSIFLITFKHFGNIPSLVATGFFALDPLVTAHGHLVTTDIAVALGVLLSAYTAWRLFTLPKWVNGLWFGLAFGFALLVKHTAIILLPIITLLTIIMIIKKRNKTFTINLLKSLLLSLGTIILLIWIFFGFQNRPLPSTPTISQDIVASQKHLDNPIAPTNKTADSIYPIVRPLLSILPGDYTKGIAMILIHTGGGHDTFLFGQSSSTGWWYYFPVLLLVKMPIPTLLAITGLIVAYFLVRPRNSLITILLTVAGLFLLAAMSSKANLGLRHVMPLLPLLFVAIGWLASINQYSKKALLIALLWLSIIFGLSFPNYIGYFNEFAGTKENNYKVATDSNLDWGQDLKRIRNYITENNLSNPYVEYGWLGHDSLNYYLKDNYQLLSEGQPSIGETVIIGATAVSGPNFNETIDRCDVLKPITNGALTCKIVK